MKLINKIFAFLGLSFAFVFSLFTISNIKVEATNFTLADGRTSKITYNEMQQLKAQTTNLVTGAVFDVYSYIFKNIDNDTDGFSIIVSNLTNSSMYYTNCSYSNDKLICSKSTSISGVQTNVSSTFVITFDNMIYKSFDDVIYNPVELYSSTDLDNSYDEGYQEGLQANQDTIYQNGYDAGYSAGESAGLTTGYNNGYSAGESAGLTTGYNNGYNAGVGDLGDYVVDDLGTAPSSQVKISVSCSGVTNDECLSNAKGKISSNIDTLVVNSTNSGYETGYSAGYSVGYSDAKNEKVIFDIVNPYYNEENLDIEYEMFNRGVYDAYECYLLNDAVLSSCNSNPGFDAYDEGFNSVLDASLVIDFNIEDLILIYENSAYRSGYSTGYNVGVDSNNNLPGIIGAVISTPINMLSNIFDFEFLGVNLTSFFFSLLSLLVVIWLVKVFF